MTRGFWLAPFASDLYLCMTPNVETDDFVLHFYFVRWTKVNQVAV